MPPVGLQERVRSGAAFGGRAARRVRAEAGSAALRDRERPGPLRLLRVPHQGRASGRLEEALGPGVPDGWRAGTPLHDFCRSAVRNLTRAGIPAVIAREITGHRTRSVLDRYDIATTKEARQAFRATVAYLIGKPPLATRQLQSGRM